jgi:hypothetical protein
MTSYKVFGVVGHFHFYNWFARYVLKRLGFRGMVIGSHVYYWAIPSDQSIVHEMRHVYQHYRLAGENRMWVGVVKFWSSYIYQWVRDGFKYSNIDLEEEARECAARWERFTITRIESWRE